MALLASTVQGGDQWGFCGDVLGVGILFAARMVDGNTDWADFADHTDFMFAAQTRRGGGTRIGHGWHGFFGLLRKLFWGWAGDSGILRNLCQTAQFDSKSIDLTLKPDYPSLSSC